MPSPGRLRLFRTTAFRLSVIYLGVFTIFAGFLITYIATSTTQLLDRQMEEAVEAEIQGLAEQYNQGGIRRLAAVIERRSRQPGASLYLVTDYAGAKISGNVEAVPPDVLNNPDSAPQLVPYARLEEGASIERHTALVRVFSLAGGFRLLVGRDTGETAELASVVRRALALTFALMVGLSLISWLFVSRRVLKRIDSISDTSRQIVAGDLSGRIKVTGTGDEFDRLAESLNTMLDRIERLMNGLKEVSDNIAHDLKTPLSRMRNRMEAALHQTGDETETREALQALIEDADQLITTFNALLMIARIEAGSSDAAFRAVDAADVAQDVFELYEPLAEEAGVRLSLNVDGPALFRANRELFSQALANLVDNAVKYADEGTNDPQVVIAVGREAGQVKVSVADNGTGIPEADLDRVTKRFIRLEASRSKPGSGLGLSLVSAVAHLHGGELVLTDNKPGLRATLALPELRNADAA